MSEQHDPPRTVHVWRARGTRLEAEGIVRVVLSEHLGVPPERVPLGRDASGRPVVHGNRIAVSISHTDGLVLVAVRTGARIGIDVELLRDGPWRLLPAHALTEHELADLERRPTQDRSEALLRYWVRKEALLKAAGVGLAVDPRAVQVSSPGEPPEVVSLPRALGHPTSWSLVDVELDGFAAALATDAPAPRVALRALDPPARRARDRAADCRAPKLTTRVGGRYCAFRGGHEER